MESVDYSEMNLQSIIEGDKKYKNQDEPYAAHGFSQQEFAGEELIDIDEEQDDATDEMELDFEEVSDDV